MTMMPRIYIARTPSEIIDLLMSMNLRAPKMLDHSGRFPEQNLDYCFRELHAGLDFNRAKLGEARFHDLKRMADEMRVLFEGDPDDNNGQTLQGCKIIHAMMDLLRQKKSAR